MNIKKLLIAGLLVIPLMVSAQSTLKTGGTGWSTSTIGDLLVGTSSTLRYTRLPVGTIGKVLYSNGTTPTWVSTSSLGISGGSGNSAWTIGNGVIYNTTSTDNVSIGTSTGGYKLNIASSTSASGGIRMTSTGLASPLFTLTNSSANSSSIYQSGDTFRLARGQVGSLSTIISVILSSGNTGIGSAVPVSLFEVGGNVGIGSSYAGVTAAPTNGLIVEGNTGVGTSSPTQKLHVSGGLRLEGGLFDSTNASGTSGMILKSTGTSTQWVATSTLFGSYLSGVGTSTNLAFFSGSNSLTSSDHLNYDVASSTLHVHQLSGDSSSGLLIESANHTTVGVFGAGNSANVTWYGNHNFNTATQDTIAGFTGAGKTLGSLSTATYPSLTELSYVKGVTSAIQTQLDTKPSFTYASSTFVTYPYASSTFMGYSYASSTFVNYTYASSTYGLIASNNTWTGSNTFATTTVRNLSVNGTSGNGWLSLVGQSANPTSPPAGTGLLHTITTNGFTTLEYDNEASTNVNILEDSVTVVKNTSGVTVNKGEVVYITGSTGNVPNIAKAQANATATLPSVFVAIDAIADNAFGQVMRSGIISNFDTSAFTTGQAVFLSTSVAGGLTATRPSGTAVFVQRIGTILVSGVGNGSIDVNVAPAIQNMESGTAQPTWTGTNVVAGGTLAVTGKTTLNNASATGISTSNLFATGTVSLATTTINGNLTITGTYVPRVTGYASNASTTFNLDTIGDGGIASTTITATTTIVNPTGTYLNGLMFEMWFKATTTQGLFWGTNFASSTDVNLPTQIASGTTKVIVEYRQDSNKLECMYVNKTFAN